MDLVVPSAWCTASLEEEQDEPSGPNPQLGEQLVKGRQLACSFKVRRGDYRMLANTRRHGLSEGRRQMDVRGERTLFQMRPGAPS